MHLYLKKLQNGPYKKVILKAFNKRNQRDITCIVNITYSSVDVKIVLLINK